MELTRSFSDEQYARALESWTFLELDGLVPVFTSPFGDVFFQAADGFWWLDTLEGTLELTWASADELRDELNTEDGQDQYLLAGLAFGAANQGVVPGPDQVYSFTHPPQLGGELTLDNVEVLDFVVSLNFLGQIHSQIRDLPPGTPISGITIS
ncbi:uncharacterized protein DUF1851 [Kribbella sp. VKM Ac-2569]|uniref:T6SS immunity protein Tdi1 domain-containing protein n=1 Tax=Kribbella sp. VKM Ac-2569 TaxID=2512220 RepID=UPI00102AFE38|nr:T6SS immunity protein Tdi1 domain-containing protein [Kribbella sp. VKM Ac-2569]RZT28607.1 uncharacterized protein DUF1851 [Kribbella sp. VKM Ac-2569]